MKTGHVHDEEEEDEDANCNSYDQSSDTVSKSEEENEEETDEPDVKQIKETFHCEQCLKNFNNRKTYENHMQYHYPSKTCPICNKVFKYKRYYKHMQGHKKVMCKHCNKLIPELNSSRHKESCSRKYAVKKEPK